MEYFQLLVSSSVPLPLTPFSPSLWSDLVYPYLELVRLQVSSAPSPPPVLTLSLLYIPFCNTFSNQPDTRASIPRSRLPLRYYNLYWKADHFICCSNNLKEVSTLLERLVDLQPLIRLASDLLASPGVTSGYLPALEQIFVDGCECVPFRLTLQQRFDLHSRLTKLVLNRPYMPAFSDQSGCHGRMEGSVQASSGQFGRVHLAETGDESVFPRDG